jgi:hypothetical protein
MMDVLPPELAEDTFNGALEEYARTKGISRVEKCLVYAPDAIGTRVHDEHSQLFQRVRDHAPLIVPMRVVYPTVTPVCFASMFTGATPECHGITKYEKPVLRCDTLFDALIRAGKKPAIVAVERCSISLIFRDREMDYFIETYDEQVADRTIQLIEEDRHDFVLAYNQEYDDVLHRTTPYSEEAIRALKNHVSAFDRIARGFEAHWKGYDRLIMFTPDHGAHISMTSGQGTHGEDIPEDMLVNHFFGVCGAGAG